LNWEGFLIAKPIKYAPDEESGAASGRASFAFLEELLVANKNLLQVFRGWYCRGRSRRSRRYQRSRSFF
jgi:hypothetical protein